MSNPAGPLYEMSFVASDAVLGDVDAWLLDVLQRARAESGIVSARSLESVSGSSGPTTRTCQFEAIDDNSLDALLDGFFVEIDTEVAEKFGGNVDVRSRILRPDRALDLPQGESPVCLNCGTRLLGQYCGHCGQRSRSRLISIWQLLREAFGDLLELDSRIWRTLIPLLVRPGRLTRDYLEGRRARYMPPFRTYLVLSVMFFVVAFFDPHKDLGLFFDPDSVPQQSETSEEAEAPAAAEQDEKHAEARRKLEALRASGKIPDDDDLTISIGTGANNSGFFENCDTASAQDEDDELPERFKKRFSDERIRIICERNKARGVDNFSEAILDNIPIALIVLLPIMALVLKALYPLSRRYFVEHLLFFVHFHAFFFLILMLQVLFARLSRVLGPEDGLIDNISTLILVVSSFYIPVYLYKAMRRVYGQGHLITLLKYLMLSTAYVTGATMTLIVVLLVAVVSA